MEQQALHDIFSAFNRENVRYLVVGGLAVVAHGYARLTMDVDLVLAFDEGNMKRAVAALQGLGFQPRAPVPFEEFVDPAKRRQWGDEKHMRVFSVWSSKYPLTELDLFLECPFPDFDAVYARAVQRELSSGVVMQVVPREELLKMKRAAGRAKDIDDVRVLTALAPEKSKA